MRMTAGQDQGSKITDEMSQVKMTTSSNDQNLFLNGQKFGLCIFWFCLLSWSEEEMKEGVKMWLFKMIAKVKKGLSMFAW